MMHFTRDRLQQQLQFIVAQSCPAANALVEYGYAAFLFGCFTASSLNLDHVKTLTISNTVE
jgi:hypothetical protein